MFLILFNYLSTYGITVVIDGIGHQTHVTAAAE